MPRSSAPAIAAPSAHDERLDDRWAGHARPDVMDRQEDPEEQDFEESSSEDLSIKSANMELIEKVLRKHGGNRKAAAAELGISERTLYRKIKQKI